MPRFNPAMAPQTGVMAMRMGAGGAAEGVAPAMQTATTSGKHDVFSHVVSVLSSLFCDVIMIIVIIVFVLIIYHRCYLLPDCVWYCDDQSYHVYDEWTRIVCRLPRDVTLVEFAAEDCAIHTPCHKVFLCLCHALVTASQLLLICNIACCMCMWICDCGHSASNAECLLPLPPSQPWVRLCGSPVYIAGARQ